MPMRINTLRMPFPKDKCILEAFVEAGRRIHEEGMHCAVVTARAFTHIPYIQIAAQELQRNGEPIYA